MTQLSQLSHLQTAAGKGGEMARGANVRTKSKGQPVRGRIRMTVTVEGIEKMTNVPIDIGIQEPDRQVITDGLSHLLADTYTLNLKRHNYHWNVTVPNPATPVRNSTHELALAVDLVAEQIRALGARDQASYREFEEFSSVTEDVDRPDATEMIRHIRRPDKRRLPAPHGRSSRSSSAPMMSQPLTYAHSGPRSTKRRPGCSGVFSIELSAGFSE